MNKEEATMIGFEIVTYAGEARSILVKALSKARNGEFDEAERLVGEANESLVDAHNVQTNMLAKEASGENIELGFIMIHGQDHLMTTLLLKEIVTDFIELYRRVGD